MNPRVASSLRLLSFVLCVAALGTFLFMFGRNNDLTTTGGVMIIVVNSIGFIALFALFYADQFHMIGLSYANRFRIFRFAGVGLVGGLAVLFAAGAFGPLVKPDYTALANAEQERTKGRYTTSTTIENCTTTGKRPAGVELKTDGFVCMVTIDGEHNAVVAHLKDGLSLNNTETIRSKDLRTLTLAFPAQGRADLYLYDVTSNLPVRNLPQEVVDAEGRGHHFDASATRYLMASSNN